MRLPGRPRAVVTGAGSGLGRALSVALGKRGGRVLVADVNEAGGRETEALVQSAGGEAAFVRCDVTAAGDLEAAAVEIERRWGGVDLLVNNAGVASAGFIGEASLELWDWTLSVNLKGVIHGCHAFVPRMKAQGRGFVLNVASSAGIVSMPEMGPYNVSKAGVISLTETLYAEVGPQGIGVSALCPTFFPTGLFDAMRTAQERQRRMARTLFARSLMGADQVAAAGLRGLERGELIIIPQVDGSLLWRLKRLWPGLFHGALRAQQKFDLAARTLGGR